MMFGPFISFFLFAMCCCNGLRIPREQNEKSVSKAIRNEICEQSKASLYQMYVQFHNAYSIQQPLSIGYYVRPRMDTSETIPFKTPGSCSNATKMDVMWCLRLASLAHNAMACIDSSGEITATPSAIQLGLQENIMLDDTGSLVVKKFQDIYMYSLISLISATKDCEGVSHHVVFMKYNDSFPPSLVSFPSTSPITVPVGGKVRVKCAFNTNKGYHYVLWVRDSDSQEDSKNPSTVPVIYEDPSCDPASGVCTVDRRYPKDNPIRSAPFTAYVHTQSVCLQPHVFRYNDLVVRHTSSARSGRYSCQLYNLQSAKPILSASVQIEFASS